MRLPKAVPKRFTHKGMNFRISRREWKGNCLLVEYQRAFGPMDSGLVGSFIVTFHQPEIAEGRSYMTARLAWDVEAWMKGPRAVLKADQEDQWKMALRASMDATEWIIERAMA